MAIHVICPGCMARFEVSDRFAGKKGPCPKCGHIIEIPKEQVVIHSPDKVTINGKQVQNPDLIRPIERTALVLSGGQIGLGLIISAVTLLLAGAAHFCPNGPVTWGIGGLAAFAAAFGVTRFGYLLVRDPEDLEILLGGELTKKSIFAALGFLAFWIIFEGLLAFLNPGVWGIFYLIPVAALASFIPVVVFDTSYGNALLLFLTYAVLALLLRMIALAPSSWLGSLRNDYSKAPNSAAVEAGGNSGVKPIAPKLNKMAPDPTKNL